MAIIRLLHLSDFHILSKNRIRYKMNGLSVCDPDALKALAQFVYVNKDDIDGILISGDIAHAGIDMHLSRAIEFFASPSGFYPREPWIDVNRRPTLRTFEKPIVVVPGNHDRYDGLLGQPNGKQFDVYFSSFWNPPASGVQPFLLPNETAPVLTIICADFTIESFAHCVPGGHWGQGKIYRERLQQLVWHTKRATASKSKVAAIWMLHFAPEFEDHCNLGFDAFFIRLLDSDYLIQEAENSGVQYILCGHTHHYAIYHAGTMRKVTIHCAGTSTCVVSTEDTTIHLLEIETDEGDIKGFKSVPFWWNPSKLVFQTDRS